MPRGERADIERCVEGFEQELLASGSMEVQGRFVGSSNATLLVTCSKDGAEMLAIYKPERGERPLWDFPRGLYRREVAAYVLARALGWPRIPTTVVREHAPFGRGSVQRFVHDDAGEHYFSLRQEPQHRDALVAIAALDVIANNADRKGGHVVLAGDVIWAIDHGLCFHREPKLRTVIWDFGGEPVPAELTGDMERLVADGLPPLLDTLLSPDERAALLERIRRMLATGLLPEAPAHDEWRTYPWPLI